MDSSLKESISADGSNNPSKPSAEAPQEDSTTEDVGGAPYSPDETNSGPVTDGKGGTSKSSEDSSSIGPKEDATLLLTALSSISAAPETEPTSEKAGSETTETAMKEGEEEEKEESTTMDVESSDANEPEPQSAPERPKVQAETSTNSNNNNNNSNNNSNNNNNNKSSGPRPSPVWEPDKHGL